jgi:hypothetical protein
MSNETKLPFELDDLTLSSGSDYIGGAYDNTFTISSPSSLTSGMDTISIGSTSIGPLTIGPIGTSNSVYTIGSTGIGGWTNSPMTAESNGSLSLQGDGADITINGVKLSETLKALQERLNVLVPNPKLEKDWEDLAELGRQYRELEKHITEKMATWDKLKSMPKIDVK